MSHFASDLPDVIIKPGRMITIPRLKLMVVMLSLLMYVYILLYIKTYYLKSKRLDRIMEMALLTEKRLMNVHNMDHKLAMRMAHIDKMYEDY